MSDDSVSIEKPGIGIISAREIEGTRFNGNTAWTAADKKNATLVNIILIIIYILA